MEKIMKILVTGAKGFIGRNLIIELKNRKYNDIYEYDVDTPDSQLEEFCKSADFVFHLAGVNRPINQEDFMIGNFGMTSKLLETLKKYNNNCPIMLSSSIQAELDNPYGKSKKAGEDLMLNYGLEFKSKVLVYRFPNVFGKWCRPNYNSVIATFCHNIANDLPINVNDPNSEMKLVYIDDLVNELIGSIEGKEHNDGNFCFVPIVHEVKLGELVDILYSFKKTRNDYYIPDLGNSFTKKLYSTYLSYLPEKEFSYELLMKVDDRGSFTEFLKTPDRGQVSVNISKPNITKGNHWHHTKTEKFLVVSGSGIIRFRKIDSNTIIEYYVNGSKLEVLDIPPGYTHNIENIGQTDMVTIMWANEMLDLDNPDTFFLEV